jgi:hypothetical protein
VIFQLFWASLAQTRGLLSCSGFKVRFSYRVVRRFGCLAIGCSAAGCSAIRQFGCSVVWLFGGWVVRRFGCSVDRLFGCAVVRRFGDSAIRLFGSSAVRRFGESAVRRLGVSAVRRFGCSALRLEDFRRCCAKLAPRWRPRAAFGGSFETYICIYIYKHRYVHTCAQWLHLHVHACKRHCRET